MTDWTRASRSELADETTAIAREVQRRDALDQAARDEAFKAELAEVRAGTRRADPEHVRHLSPAEVVTAINNGQLRHQGVAPDRRLSRRR
jgi:hypothetical protein